LKNLRKNSCLIISGELLIINDQKINYDKEIINSFTGFVSEQNDYMSEFNIQARGFNLSTDMVRIFKYDLEHGGRFYYKGLSPQQCPQIVRKEILINSSEVVEPDYSAFHTTICYSILNLKAPIDIYKLSSNLPKNLIKPILTRIYYSKSRIELKESLKKYNKESKNKYYNDLSKYYSTDIINSAIDDIMLLHDPIKKFFYSNQWGMLQRIDSNIAMEVMLLLRKKEIPCLCIHDSFIVPKQYSRILIDIMREAYFNVTLVDNAIIKTAA